MIEVEPETTWIWSDLHLSDPGVIGAWKRPFRDVRHMDRELLAAWRGHVRDDDTIICLGDVAHPDFWWCNHWNTADPRGMPGPADPHPGQPRHPGRRTPQTRRFHPSALGSAPLHRPDARADAPAAEAAPAPRVERARPHPRGGTAEPETRKRLGRAHRLPTATSGRGDQEAVTPGDTTGEDDGCGGRARGLQPDP